jgi:mRNA-degrading endonuclease toxin of MazEF toxin-antitoxin module
MEAGHKRYAVLSCTPWSRDLSAYTFSPITSKFDKRGQPKKHLFAVDLPRSESGQTHPGLLLVSQIESLRFSDIAAEWSADRLVSCKHQLEAPRLAGARHLLKQILVTKASLQLPRPKRAVSNLSMASGELVMLQNDGASVVEPWIVVSSDLWLRTLEITALHTVKGFARPFVALVPLTPTMSTSDDPLGLEIPPTPPHLPKGAYCHASLVVARSVEKIRSVPLSMNKDLLENVATVMELALGLDQ